MAVRAKLVLALAATTCLGGCALFQPKPVVENRFKSVSSATSVPGVELLVSTTEPQSDGGGGGGVALTSLSDRGQAALIAATGGKPPTKLKDAGKTGGGVDRVQVHGTVRRSVVIAVRPVDFLAPGDRVDAIRVAVQVAPGQKGGWKIDSWTQATNGTTTIDIGKLSNVTTSKLTGETGLKLDHALPDAKIGAEFGRTNTQELDIKDTSELSAAVDGNGQAWLYDVAGWRENLAHNLSIDVVISADAAHLGPSTFVAASDLTKDDGKGKSVPAAAGDVSLTEISVYGSDASTQSICGHATLHYRVRHITDANAAATFSESDDVVEFKTGESKTDFVLSPPPVEPGYGLFVGKSVVSYDIREGKHAGLRFQTLEEAIEFGDWLNIATPKDGKLGNATIGLLDKNLVLQPMTAAQTRQLLAGVLDVDAVGEARKSALKGCPAA